MGEGRSTPFHHMRICEFSTLDYCIYPSFFVYLLFCPNFILFCVLLLLLSCKFPLWNNKGSESELLKGTSTLL